ncbi:hypothetical protein SKAU_G00336850 [Synaphobranchus kaupii]|uniref:Uncharacterized protein n=1 Tax=Synaphobranchus kaupii TaxID=118154 RepID=A0A9Q1EMA6_SYNKA|nr:hypothetical protein SKAU_G00336850 [Synaphobranchus kaupii]
METFSEGYSCCRGLWVYLDQQSFTRIQLLLQRLRNLLSFNRWRRSQASTTHRWPGEALGPGVPGHRAEHLAGPPGAVIVMKHIAQMWRKMDQNHRRACQESPGSQWICGSAQTSLAFLATPPHC